MTKVVLLASLAISCSAPGPVKPAHPASAYDLPVVQGSSHLGVIFPTDQAADTVRLLGMEVHEYWTPTPSEIEKCEAHLRDALERGVRSPEVIDPWSQGKPERRDYVTREIGKVLEHLGEYRRQYVGTIMSDGTKRIVVNCFPGHRGDSQDAFSYWRQRFVVVDDGGFWYWHIQYDVATDQYLEFDSNGYA
jgi:hypothetical protein